jgi:membrane protein DedA with SNARE-associated domain
MSYRRFLGYELNAALFWTGGYCLLGYLLGAQLQALQGMIEQWGLALIPALIALYLGWRIARGRIRRLFQPARRRAVQMS